MPSFASETIFHLGNIAISNTILSTLLADAILIACVFVLYKNMRSVPNLFQNIIETVIETFYNITESVASKRAAIIFPYFMSFFLFILIANWSSLVPGFGSIGFFEGEHFIPILRGTTSDLNTTLGLALVSAFATHTLAIKITGVKEYLGRFFSFNPINLFIGILELISEITKIVSLSFRLFGNIFAGEVVLLTTASIFAFILPVPFLLLEVIVGLVQALVFAMLTMTFMAILTAPHHEVQTVNKDKTTLSLHEGGKGR